jgi:hypothetical protein
MNIEILSKTIKRNDIIVCYSGKEIVFLTEIYPDETVVIRFKSGKKIIAYSNEPFLVERREGIKIEYNQIIKKKPFKTNQTSSLL